MQKMNYRLALDLGSTSLGWAMVRLNADNPPAPVAVIKAGVRIFNSGRDAKTEASLAVTRREARAMRRRRDRLLKRKARMMRLLQQHKFFPKELPECKELQTLNPYTLRAKGLNEALTPEEFGRALFHINQRRGFKSNRKTDKGASDAGALKSAISQLRQQLDLTAQDGKARTVGELLWRRLNDENLPKEQRTVRARYREAKIVKEDGKSKIDKSYDLYIDRKMIEDEFDALWAKQASFNAKQFNEAARVDLKDCLLHQRHLKPVVPGRCTLIPEEPRAPLALPSQQQFRMYQELHNLRILREGLKEEALSLEQRNMVMAALEEKSKLSFTQIKKIPGLKGAEQFNLEDAKREELKGNSTSAALSKKECFGHAWFSFDLEKQDQIVMQLLTEENETKLVQWLIAECNADEAHAEVIANIGLAEGYGSLSAKALNRILPVLQKEVMTYDKAVKEAGFEHHSHISHAATGEILRELPYYGEYLQRHVGFGTGKPDDVPEKRFGKIANPTVHIGLNQVKKVVNAIINRYGHPAEVIIELARDLKQSRDQKAEATKRQASNQKRNERIKKEIAAINHKGNELLVRHADIQKWILWEELSFNVADRKCPYSGKQISAQMLLSDEVEIEHILPFSQTLDDSLNNKTVSTRAANRIKENKTPWEAFGKQAVQGFNYTDILQRATLMPIPKRYRFGEEGYQQWLRDDKGFLARALNDTRYLSRIAKEYLSLICPQDTRVIPGQMTAKLRHHFGLNQILDDDGEKNRNDHRHHAIDACVIAVTDQGMLNRFAQANASARKQQLNRLVENMPMPWGTDQDHKYRESVRRAIETIKVSHKPEHGYEGVMHEATAWGLLQNGLTTRRTRNEVGQRVRETKMRSVIPFNSTSDINRHGFDEEGKVKNYKGYVGGSNFCMDIVKNEKGKWEGEIVSTYTAYQIIRELGREKGLKRLQSKSLSVSGKPLVMRLQNGDIVKMKVDDSWKLMRVVALSATSGQMFFAEHREANADARNRNKEDPFQYVSKYAGSLQKTEARRVTISPIGEVNDLGWSQ